MRVQFVQDFEAKTATGIQTIAAGTVLDLGEYKASRLMTAGVVKAVDAEPYFNPTALPYLDSRCRLVIPYDCPPKYRYWAGGQSIRDTLKEIFEERAATMTFEGEMTRELAEEEAKTIMARYVSEHSIPDQK